MEEVAYIHRHLVQNSMCYTVSVGLVRSCKHGLCVYLHSCGAVSGGAELAVCCPSTMLENCLGRAFSFLSICYGICHKPEVSVDILQKKFEL